MKRNDLSFLIGGFAGQGVQTVGQGFALMCARAGLHVFVNHEYPSNIKGEHNYTQIMVSENEVGSTIEGIDLLLALDAKSVILHQDKLFPGGALIYDSEGLEVSPVDKGRIEAKVTRDDVLVIDLPCERIAKEVGGTKRMINTIGMAAVQGLLQFDFGELEGMVRESLGKLGEEKLEKNVEGARRAYDAVREKYAGDFGVTLERRDGPKRMLVSGTEALGLGALKAGVKFYSSYPMSPSSKLLGFMCKNARRYGLVALLTEDEISAAGMAVGAAFAGVRAMTGTSGGGFCLISEHFGLAGNCEIPLVVFEAQRPGPATGLPTRTEQGDLRFILSAHQGDFPRIVVAPGDPAEAFRLGFEAFNLADRYQTPVVVLQDKHLAESFWTYEPFAIDGMEIDRGEALDEARLRAIADFRRFCVTESGISPRAHPGTPGGMFTATGNEHDVTGHTSESPEDRTAQTAKRLRKLDSLDVSDIGWKLHGDSEADLTLVAWGSTKPVILDVMDALKKRRGVNCNFLQLIYMNPFPSGRVGEILGKAKRTFAVENNATGQLAALIAEKTGCFVDEKILKWNGRQFLRDELAELIEQRL